MSDRLNNALFRRVVAWASQLTGLAKSYAPAHLKPYIHSKIEDKDDSFIIRTTINRRENPLEKYGSMDARAQEYGSGLRARRGPKKKYEILPKNKQVLVFPWDKANPNLPHTKDGRVILHSVQHPGIQAANEGQGYIAPAQRELRKRAKAELNKDIKDAIVGDLRESFGRSK